MKSGRVSHICIFEDSSAEHFLPLVYFRPVCNLRTGILSLKEKVLARFPRVRVTMHCRPYLAPYMRLRNPGLAVNEIPGSDCLFVNGRVRVDADFFRTVGSSPAERVYISRGAVVAARVTGTRLDRVRSRLENPLTLEDFEGLPSEEISASVLTYPWDLVHANGDEIVHDTRLLRKGRRSPVSPAKLRTSGVSIAGAADVFVGKGSTIGPGSVIDATEGPVVLGEHVRVFPHATIVGPAFIGNGSTVKVGAQIYGNTSIGPVCKVGGEIEGSIIHGYSNKQHHGFIGHSYIGAWANLGAGTTNSDLKNNYGQVRVTLGSRVVDTGLQFVGLTLGDHSKTAINSMFNTGTIVGVSCNIFGFGFPPKYVPSFSWGAAGETFTTHGLEQAITLATRVMARRNITLSGPEIQLFRDIFRVTAGERRRLGMPA